MSIDNLLIETANDIFKTEGRMRVETLKLIASAEEKSALMRSNLDAIYSLEVIPEEFIERTIPEIKVFSDWLEQTLEVLRTKLTKYPEESAIPAEVLNRINGLSEVLNELRSEINNYIAFAEEEGDVVEIAPY